MSVNINFTGAATGDHATDLCSNRAYYNLCAWFDKISKDGNYPALKKLSRENEYNNTDDLWNQLWTAIDEDPPKDKYVLETANRLFELLGGGDKNETVSIDS